MAKMTKNTYLSKFISTKKKSEIPQPSRGFHGDVDENTNPNHFMRPFNLGSKNKKALALKKSIQLSKKHENMHEQINSSS